MVISTIRSTSRINEVGYWNTLTFRHVKTWTVHSISVLSKQTGRYATNYEQSEGNACYEGDVRVGVMPNPTLHLHPVRVPSNPDKLLENGVLWTVSLKQTIFSDNSRHWEPFFRKKKHIHLNIAHKPCHQESHTAFSAWPVASPTPRSLTS